MSFYRRFFSNKYFILSDQVLTSLMNFGSVLALSSLLNDNLFSEFVILYSYSTLANIVLTTIFSAPILVFGIKKWDKEKFNYLGANVIYFSVFNIFFSLIAFIFLRMQVKEIFVLNFLLMNFGMTLIEIFKRFIFSNKVVSLAYVPFSSLLMNIVFFGGILIIRKPLDMNMILSIYWVSYLTACVFFIAILFFFTNVKTEFSLIKSINKNFSKKVFFTHFKYAKWVLAGAVSFWVYTQGIYIFGKAMGVTDFAISKLRIVQNLFGVFTILLIAMDNYLTPIFSTKAVESEHLIVITLKEIYKRYSKSLMYFYIMLIPIMYLAYFLLYQDKYGDGMIYIFLVWLTQLMAISTKPISIALKAKEVTYPLFFSHLFAAISMVIFGGVLMFFLNDLGFVLTMLLSFMVANVMNYVYFKRVFI